MRAITKGQEPQSLTQHRLTQHASYDNYAQKDDLRASLTTEQRGLCCYCMGRIRIATASMKIEHWKCQSGNQALELAYSNLLGACTGGEGRPGREQHCDTCKADRDLRWNPATPQHVIETRVVFDLDGTIRSPDNGFNDELNSVLNLNMAWLKQNRKKALDGLLSWYRAAATKPSRNRLEQEYARVAGAGTNAELEPYSPVAAAWLKRKLEA